MIKEIVSALDEIDALILTIDLTTLLKYENVDKSIADNLRFIEKSAAPKILALNKIDRLTKEQLFPIIKRISDTFQFDEIVPVSALRGYNIDELLVSIKKYLKNENVYYPPDYKTDLTDKIYISELVREKILLLTTAEVPHSIACETVEITERADKKSYVKVRIYTERDSQKAIIIGKRGSMLKKIGARARLEIEEYLNSPIYLELEVKVMENWRSDINKLREIGY